MLFNRLARFDYILGLSLMLVSFKSIAWQPCQPFCDAGCGGAALLALGTSITGQSTTQTSANSTHLNGITNLINSYSQFGVDIVNLYTQDMMDTLSSLDARTNKIELALNQNQKTMVNMIDTKNNTIVNAFKESFIMKNVLDNNRQFSSHSIPESYILSANASPSIRTAYEKSENQIKEIAPIKQQYNNELDAVDHTLSIATKLDISDTEYNLNDLIESKTLADDKIKPLQKLVAYITNHKPLKKISADVMSTQVGADYELKRRQYNAKINYIQIILDRFIARKTQYMSDDWIQSYVFRSSIQPGMSFDESISSMIKGRLSSEGWYQNIKLLEAPGIRREITYLSAEENTLLYLLSELRESRNNLLALIALEKL